MYVNILTNTPVVYYCQVNRVLCNPQNNAFSVITLHLCKLSVTCHRLEKTLIPH